MGCCLCEKYEWPDPQEVVWRDEQDGGKEYCVFHTPVEHKGISYKEYEILVHARINDFKATASDDSRCKFSGAFFNDDFFFRGYGKDNPLPSISFAEAKFGEMASFDGTTFGKRASFNGTTFGEAVTFFGAKFGEKASFFNATFGDQAAFNGAKFGKKASFNAAIFGETAPFFSVTFGDQAAFGGATFGGRANFCGATFGEEARFDGATLGKGTSFEKTTFSGSSFFTSATLQEGTTFSKTKFHGSYFFKATFGDRVLFSEVEFDGPSSFYGTHFGSQVIYSKCTFGKHAIFRNPLSITDLRFQYMGTKQFKNTDFLDCSLKNITFTNVGWHKHESEERFCIPIIEENKAKLASVAEFYRQMKKRCRDEQNDAEASLWHYAEKETTRKHLRYTKDKPFKRFYYWLYYHISRYGEDPKQALLVLLMLATILGIFVILGAAFAPEPSKDSKALDFGGVIHVFFQYLLFDRPSYDLNKFFAAPALLLSRLLIPIQAAIFAFALRNKLHR